MSLFTSKNGLMARDPNGGVESCDLMKAAGWEWIACNVGDFPPESWQKVRDRAEAAGMVCLPWLYVWKLYDLDFLIEVADEWSGQLQGASFDPSQVPVVVNVEKQLDDGTYSAKEVADRVGGRDAGISTESWLYFDVEWQYLTKYPVMLQGFPFENNVWDFAGCETRARDAGFDCVLWTWGAYDVAGGPHSGGKEQPTPSDYAPFYKAPLSVYTVDDLTYDYPASYTTWMPVGSYDPCQTDTPPPPEEPQPMVPFIRTPLEIPFTGPYKKGQSSTTAQALKRALTVLNMYPVTASGTYDNGYNDKLVAGMKEYQKAVSLPETGEYKVDDWEKMRRSVISSGSKIDRYVLDEYGCQLIRSDYDS